MHCSKLCAIYVYINDTLPGKGRVASRRCFRELNVVYGDTLIGTHFQGLESAMDLYLFGNVTTLPLRRHSKLWRCIST